jgi:hypothetical protein
VKGHEGEDKNPMAWDEALKTFKDEVRKFYSEKFNEESESDSDVESVNRIERANAVPGLSKEEKA